MCKKSLKIILLLLVIVLSLCGCGDTKQLRIDDYKIHKMNGLVSDECIAYCQEVAKSRFDVKLGKTDGTNERSLFLVSDTKYAADLGYSLENMREGAFVIVNINNGIYCIAPTEDGVKRAFSYFVKNLVEQDGIIVLNAGQDYINIGTKQKTSIKVGETELSEYVIAYESKEAKEAGELLQYYIQQTSGARLELSEHKKADSKRIFLQLDAKISPQERYTEITDGNITITAGSEEALETEVCIFANVYLGWMHAGTEKEKISAVASELHIPENVVKKEAWIEEREAIVTLWNLNHARGTYLDSDVSTKTNILDFTEEQIYEYVKMLKYCGFTGVQATEMCSTWAATDGYEAGHEKLRMMADAAHSMDMKFTMWVWGAEFADCGWIDDDVLQAFYGSGQLARNDSDAMAMFEKYYNIYSELADCCDRVIGHFHDPGNLHDAGDIAYYAGMLRDKCLAVNPDIDFGISCWVDIYDKATFVQELGNDITLYECGWRANPETYTAFRTQVKNLGCRLGTWAWNTCEMETDQLAQMNFNLEIIRSVYQTARQYDAVMKPSYWSEMDANHVINVFSLYCAGQLLIDPDTPSEDIYTQISTATVGPEYAEAFAEILSIIQDARSGYTYDTYTWSSENYILKSDAYPAESILKRCETVLPILDEMIEKDIESYSLPLPISLNDLLQLIRPHLMQVQDFAQFRLDLDKLEKDYASGVGAQVLSERLYEASEPVKNYNTVIGAWGQIEARAQYEMVMEFCEKTGLEVPMHAAFQKERKDRILAYIIERQMEHDEPYLLEAPYYQLGLAYGPEETARLVQELVDEGLLVRAEDDKVYLENWENYLYHFD
ncbi:MAG: hypothetical protein IKL22_06015 [Lachnospiraceae bacterium]|nr:hypothetical protein [Lachnospiraceae bacterium]